MLDQATFLRLNEILGNWLILNKFLDLMESQKAISLYQELINISLQEEEMTVLVSYKSLKSKLNYGYESIRKALIELEKFGLVKKGNMLNDRRFYIELNHDFWIKNLKGLL